VDPTQSASVRVLRFGVFELDVSSGELRRNGSIVRLPPQPFQVLQLLAENSGAVVNRDQIRRQVWGETTVDFDRSLNVCIAQIRTALNDDADSPRFVQTLPRKGYRFLAAVERVAVEPAAVEVSAESVPVAAGRQKRSWMSLAIVAASLLVIALAAGAYRLGHQPEPAIRIAVLPFDAVGFSADSPQIEGLFDELLTRLGGVQPDRLRVIGRRSSVIFRNERKPLREIGARLNVGYIVESTVTMEGSRLRVASRLSETTGESIVWSETFVQEAGPEQFEEQFVARVSAAVLSKLFPQSSPLMAKQAGCRDDLDAYRTGHALASRGTRADTEKSVTFF